MIISRIIGGLGNQMFQYATGRVVSLHHDVPLRRDLSDYASYSLHQGEALTRVFGCRTPSASTADLRELLGWQAPRLARRLMARRELRAFRHSRFIVEPSFAYWPGIWNVPESCYLYGYWQSPRYFSSQADQILADFTFQPPLAGRNAELAEEIAGCRAVSVHVRRGDYLSKPANQSIYHTCGPDYYERAAQHLQQNHERLVYYVFSDDMAWCREHLPLGPDCRFIDHNQQMDSHFDMQLMSLCQHHIIANSSFSWWGAWLSQRRGKTVIAPADWFRDGRPDGDLCPEEWIRL